MQMPATRSDGLAALEAFLPRARLYARDRNFVRPGHPAVSGLSPLLRHRLITEREAADRVIAAHGFHRVEKFIQEIYWRRYWKSWLWQRPDVWHDAIGNSIPAESTRDGDLAMAVMRAECGNPVIDWFARELLDTGYLHNHARMWFAGWWIHEARLPWRWGAAFFMSHLLDGCPASNTLSWRWVAGLQTPGKSYLARRANLEKYLDPEILRNVRDGLAAFENPRPIAVDGATMPPTRAAESARMRTRPHGRCGIWIHEEDLLAESSPIAGEAAVALMVTGQPEGWQRHRYSERRIEWIRRALDDAANRAASHWSVVPGRCDPQSPGDTLAEWACGHGLDEIVALRPETGPLDDALPAINASLAARGVVLTLFDRPEDVALRPFATRGFFPFWKKTSVMIAAASKAPELPGIS